LEDAAIGVVGRDATGQFEEGADPGLMAGDEAFDGEPGIGPAQSGADGADEDVEQEMDLVLIATAEVGEIAIPIHELLQPGARFGRSRWVGRRLHETNSKS